MSTALDLTTKATLTRTFDTSVTDGGQVVAPFDTILSLDADSDPDVTEGAFGSKAMAAGAATIDLTAFVDSQGRTVSFGGLRPRVVKIRALDANAGDITIAKGASNGYTGFGAAYSETLKPGHEVTRYLGATGTAVSGSVKTLDLSGTGTDGIQLTIAAGSA